MNKIPVTGIISTVYPTDNYPVIDPLLGIDGLRCVNSLTEMYNIPLERRRGGMVVGVQNTSNNTTTYYKLKPGVTWSVGTLSLTDWDLFFTFGTGGGGTALSVKYNISNETIIVPTNYEYLLYGDLTIGTGGNFQNYGKTVIMNGDIILTDNGTYSNYGQLQLVSLSLSSKYSASFSVSLGSSLTINHGLGNSDIVYTIRDGNNYIYPNVEIIDGNNILVTTTGTISSGRINIMA